MTNRQQPKSFSISYFPYDRERVVRVYRGAKKVTPENWIVNGTWVNFKASYTNKMRWNRKPEKGQRRESKYQAYNIWEKRWAGTPNGLTEQDKEKALQLLRQVEKFVYKPESY
jgi:hypothetical protein